jgi:hypothetical protein
MIFSPDTRDLEDVALTIDYYFKKKLKRGEIEIQTFSALNEPSNMGCSLGIGGEVLVVFDRRICPKEERRIELKAGYEREALVQLALKMSQEYCDKAGVPYIQYVGEMRNGAEEMFIAKVDGVKDKIQLRLEGRI